MRRFYHSDFPRDIKMDADFVKILEGVCDTPKRILTKSEKVPKAFAFGNSSIIYNIENASFFAGVRKTAFLIYDPFLFRVLRRFHRSSVPRSVKTDAGFIGDARRRITDTPSGGTDGRCAVFTLRP